MATGKQKLPKFTGEGTEDPTWHCKICITIWQAKGENDTDKWLKAFPATLRGMAIDWYTDLEATWKDLCTAFEEEFKLLRDDDEIVTEIYNTREGKNESMRAYSRRPKELVEKLDYKPADELKKRWFIKGLTPSLRRKMKIVPPSSFAKACTRAMDIESESKIGKGRRHRSGSKSSEGSGDESITIQALWKDMMRMMRELTASKEEKR